MKTKQPQIKVPSVPNSDLPSGPHGFPELCHRVRCQGLLHPANAPRDSLSYARRFGCFRLGQLHRVRVHGIQVSRLPADERGLFAASYLFAFYNGRGRRWVQDKGRDEQPFCSHPASVPRAWPDSMTTVFAQKRFSARRSKPVSLSPQPPAEFPSVMVCGVSGR